MSNYEKLIKQATKPKPGAPKAKYIDPVIASSFSQDGSLQDICRAIAGRLNDPSSLVVFRSLIVVHTLIRNGGIDNVMSHLASNQGALKLRNVVAGGNWQGYDAPKMLAPYAAYIDERIKAYRELKRDAIRASDPARNRGGRSSSGAPNEGSLTGQRLRRLTVDKGLLREVSIAQKVCSRLQDIFYAYFTDNTQDEMAMTAFRMALKDMLAIYAAINEGVINVLEHYFEMSKTDASKALEIYKRFCTHTEKIVAYMASAKKVAYSLNVPIPNLRHAPVSLAGALQEYLDDPNFEQNRLEYKENKKIIDSGGSLSSKPKAMESKSSASQQKNITIKEPIAEEKTKSVKPPTSNQALQDFFESIETDQMSMFGTQQQQQQQSYMTGMNPQMIAQQPTGYNPFMNGGGGGGGGGGLMMPQQTGFMQPQQTGFFAPQQTGYMMPQQTGFLQPQMTGFNPFRQSVMAQPTGQDAFGSLFSNGGPSNATLSPAISSAAAAGPSTSTPSSPAPFQQPTRSATAPIKPLSAQKTGSRNPFAPPPGERVPTPPLVGPKGPSLRELAMGGMGSTQGPSAGGGGNYGLGASASWIGNTNGQQPQQQQQQQASDAFQLMPQKTGLIGSVASEFVNGSGNKMVKESSTLTAQSPAPTINNTNTNDFTSSFSSLSIQQPSQPSTLQAPLQSQPTGYGGSTVKPFQPTSSFGARLLSPSPAPILPSMTGNPFANIASSSNLQTSAISQPSASVTPAYGGGTPFATMNSNNGAVSPSYGTSLQTNGASASYFGDNNGTSKGVNSQPTGFGASLFGTNNAPSNGTQALPSQPTGFGSSLFSTMSNNGGTASQPLTSQPTGFGGSSVKPFQPSSAFGSATFGNNTTPQQQQQQQHQPFSTTATGSLF